MTYKPTDWNSVIAAWRVDMNAKISQLSVAVALNSGEPVKIVKEEKQMLNFDKYREVIMREDVDRDELDCHIAALRGIKDCGNCGCNVCMRASFRWLFSEYEPPLLKNGDGLKPGDWIMVRRISCDAWNKRQFAFYYDSMFYCAVFGKDINDCGFSKWEQARLPEKGE